MRRTTWVLKDTITLLLVLLLVHHIGLAQTDPWDRVKLIEPGKNVRVKLQTGQTVKGRMESSDAESINLRQGKDKTVRVAKSDVAQVAMLLGWSRGRKATYGFVIGAAAGAGLMGAACASNCDFGPMDAAGMVAGGALWIGAITAGIAALFPQHTEVIYAANSAPVGSKVPKQTGQQARN